jgi:urease accessory protein
MGAGAAAGACGRVNTRVEVVARRGPGGRTVLPVIRASGQLAVRRTGADTVHLVATAFGPLGGDDVEIRLVVEEGATLRVRSVAAAVALPARDGGAPSASTVRATVDGVLDLRLEPTVVAAGAHHVASVVARLSAGAEMTTAEQVLLGRSGEPPGRWTGTTRIEREDVPVLHTTVGLGPGAAAWAPPVAPRAYVSIVHLGTAAEVATAADAVRLPLPGGWVATGWGTELHRVSAAVAELTAPAGIRVSA